MSSPLSLIQAGKFFAFFSFLAISYFNLDIRIKKVNCNQSTQTEEDETYLENYKISDEDIPPAIVKKNNYFKWK